MRENLASALLSSSAVLILLVIGYVVLEDMVRAEPSVLIWFGTLKSPSYGFYPVITDG